MRRDGNNIAEITERLRQAEEAAHANPREVFGFADYGKSWPRLNKNTHGIHPNEFMVLGGRQKTGKSMLVADWLPAIAAQAPDGEVVRLFSLEMTADAFTERMAAILAAIPDPINIKTGLLTDEQRVRYGEALEHIASLPIRIYDRRLNFGLLDRMVRDEREPTFFWALDNFGLMSDLGESREGGVRGAVDLANSLQELAQSFRTGLVVVHLNRASVGKRPDLTSIAASDQIGRNADTIFLLHRLVDTYDLSPSLFEEGIEPAELIVKARNLPGGADLLWWSSKFAQFREMSGDDFDEWRDVLTPKKKSKGR